MVTRCQEKYTLHSLLRILAIPSQGSTYVQTTVCWGSGPPQVTVKHSRLCRPHSLMGIMATASQGGLVAKLRDLFKSYVQHAVPRREVREKPQWEPSTDRMDGWSTSRKDYGPKEGMKQASCKPEAVPFRSTEPFDGSSTQRADFVQRQGERVRRREPETYRKPEGELEFNTTAKMAYTRKPMEKATPIRPQETHIEPGKFDGTSTNRVSCGPEFRGSPRTSVLKTGLVPPSPLKAKI